MVVFNKCAKCGNPLYFKDGKPKCFYCGAEPSDEEAIVKYESEVVIE